MDWQTNGRGTQTHILTHKQKQRSRKNKQTLEIYYAYIINKAEVNKREDYWKTKRQKILKSDIQQNKLTLSHTNIHIHTHAGKSWLWKFCV